METSISPKATNVSSAIQWEQSLHDFCKVSDDHIENLKALRADASISDRSLLSIHPINSSAVPSTAANTSFAGGSINTNLEKKIDIMLRRVKFMEERIKGYEESNDKMGDEIKNQARVIEHLLDSKSNNEKYIQKLHEEIKKLMKMNSTSSIDENVINSLLDSKIEDRLSTFASKAKVESMQSVLQENIDTAMTKIANEQQSILLKWTERYNANARFPLAVEKEIDIIKSKVHTFQDLTSNMDKKCADILNAYRDELKSSIDTMRHGIDDKLNSFIENNKIVSKSNDNKARDAAIEAKIESKLSPLNMKMLQFESEIESLYKRVDQISSSSLLISSQAAEMELSYKRNMDSINMKLEQYSNINDDNTEYMKSNLSRVHSMVEESESASRAAIESIVENLELYKSVTDNLIQTISDTLNSYIQSSAGTMDNVKQNLMEQSHFIVTMQTDLDSKLLASSRSLDAYKLELGKTLQNLYECDRKTRSKVVEIHEKFTVFSKTRVIIEKIIAEFDLRAQENIAWPQHLKSVTEALDQRITSFEKTIPTMLSSFQERLAQIENNNNNNNNNNNLLSLASQPLEDVSAVAIDALNSNASQSYVSIDEINRKKKLHREEFLKTVHK